MFRITKDPSSGSDNLYLTEITYNGSNVLIICVVGFWLRILDLWCVCVCVCVCVRALRRTVQYFPARRNAHIQHRYTI